MGNYHIIGGISSLQRFYYEQCDKFDNIKKLNSIISENPALKKINIDEEAVEKVKKRYEGMNYIIRRYEALYDISPLSRKCLGSFDSSLICKGYNDIRIKQENKLKMYNDMKFILENKSLLEAKHRDEYFDNIIKRVLSGE